jgi:hypothetical protein
MRDATRLIFIAIGVCVLLAAAPAFARPTEVNPLGLFYDNSFGNFAEYEHPTAMLIAGNCNRYDSRFTQARAAGAEVLAYLNPTAVYDKLPCKTAGGLYGPDRERVPLWPFPNYGERSSWPHTRMTDIRAGSEWSNHVVEYVEHLMREGKVDGVFLDVVGARVWSDQTSWSDWPKEEQDAWTRGNIDLVRRIDAARRAINPKFIVVNNSLWDRGDAAGFAGEQYVDGVVLEHPPLNEFHEKYAGRPFGNLGHRRVLVIARNTEDALRWAAVPGVTNVTDERKYGHPDLPLVSSVPLNDRRQN